MNINFSHKAYKNISAALLPVLLTAAVLLYSFYAGGLYPFGRGTVAWCDMQQQVVPLMCDFKDILSGKAGAFLNMQNAGGMNMWGVIFFFLASPLSALSLLVDKSDMMVFMNVLTLLKLCLCALTAAIYFIKCQPRLSPMFSVPLSTAYALCGYGMMFYQNNIWLDTMYLFPLLMISFDSLTKKGRILPYTLALTAFAVVNYYITYMAVIFVLLYFSAYVFIFNGKHHDRVPLLFVTGSALAALLSAVVWLPSFLQYLASGRGDSSIIGGLESCSFVGEIFTKLPVLMCSAAAVTVTLMCICDGKGRTKRMRLYLFLLVMTTVPLVIEPVNLMWHTGNYMSFPARYGFMTLFMLTACTGLFLSDRHRTPAAQHSTVTVIFAELVCAFVGVVSVWSNLRYTSENLDSLARYSKSLWGDEASFKGLLGMFITMFIFVGIAYGLYRKGFVRKQVLAIVLTASVLCDGVTSTQIYMTYPNTLNPARESKYESVIDLADKIDSDSFTRVTTTEKLFDVNLVGAMGYNSISHYTSLTDRDYMYTMQRLGYSSYWMEVGSYGGTEITDCALSVGYKISKLSDTSDSIYSNSKYSLNRLSDFVPLGIITDGQQTADLSGLTRGEIQQLVYTQVLGGEGEAVIDYTDSLTESSSAVTRTVNGYSLTADNVLSCTLDISGRQSLYLDMFQGVSSNLTDKCYGSLSVTVNGLTADESYPSQTQNGLLKLGEFENERVTVTVTVEKSAAVESFGLFGVDLDKISATADSVRSADLKYTDGGIYGSVTASEGEYCAVTVPQSDSLTVKVNGRTVDTETFMGDFVLIPLTEGENDIEITSTPKGFTAGLLLSLIGAVLTVLYCIFGKKIKPSERLETVCIGITTALGGLVVAAVYVIPLLIHNA